MAQLLITGGAGFIGSHSCLVLLEAGHNLVVLDNFDNSSPESLKRVLELAGPSAVGRLRVVEGDIRSAADLELAFEAAPSGQPITAVEKCKLRPRQRPTTASRPGSYTGRRLRSAPFQAAIRSALRSTTVTITSGQRSAITAIVGPPT